MGWLLPTHFLKKVEEHMKKNAKKFLFAVAIIIIWWLASLAVNKSLFLPSPVETWNVIVELLETGAFFKHLGSSFLRVIIGICISTLIAVPLGMAIAWNKEVNKVLKPVVDSLRYIPVTCFSPMLVLIFGIDEKMKITFLVIAGLFSFLPTVIQTCSEPIDKLKETAYTMGFSYPRMLLHCFIPYITPSLLQSFITLYGVGWTYVIIAEVNNTQYGLGHLMYIGSARGKTPMVFAAIVIIIVVSYVFDKVSNFIIKKTFKWRFEDERKQNG